MVIRPGDVLAWDRLGDALIQRRIDLHFRNRRAFCDARQIGYRLIFDVEEHRRTNFAKATLLDIARAYLITPESIERTLRGGDLEPLPETVTAAPEPPMAPGTAEHASDPAALAAANAVGSLLSPIEQEVWAEIRRARMRDPNPSGAVVFPGNAREQRLWDLDLIPERKRAHTIAFLRLMDAEETEENAAQEDQPGRPRHAK